MNHEDGKALRGRNDRFASIQTEDAWISILRSVTSRDRIMCEGFPQRLPGTRIEYPLFIRVRTLAFF